MADTRVSQVANCELQYENKKFIFIVSVSNLYFHCFLQASFIVVFISGKFVLLFLSESLEVAFPMAWESDSGCLPRVMERGVVGKIKDG